MRIRTKLFAIIGTLSLVVGAVAGIGVASLESYSAAADNERAASTRAIYGERLNRMVTAVVMDSRGIYAATDTRDAKRYADPILASLKDMNALLARWEPVILPEQRPMFDKVKQGAAAFITLRHIARRTCFVGRGKEFDTLADSVGGLLEAVLGDERFIDDGRVRLLRTEHLTGGEKLEARGSVRHAHAANQFLPHAVVGAKHATRRQR